MQKTKKSPPTSARKKQYPISTPNWYTNADKKRQQLQVWVTRSGKPLPSTLRIGFQDCRQVQSCHPLTLPPTLSPSHPPSHPPTHPLTHPSTRHPPPTDQPTTTALFRKVAESMSHPYLPGPKAPPQCVVLCASEMQQPGVAPLSTKQEETQGPPTLPVDKFR